MVKLYTWNIRKEILSWINISAFIDVSNLLKRGDTFHLLFLVSRFRHITSITLLYVMQYSFMGLDSKRKQNFILAWKCDEMIE